MRVLIIDGANVVGARPDGWWRDRPGAAGRLHAQLATAHLPYDRVVLVLEGAARRGAPAGREGQLLTVHALVSGDDAIVDEARAGVGAAREVVVVTADRMLRERLAKVGAAVRGPGWLLEQLDQRAADARER